MRFNIIMIIWTTPERKMRTRRLLRSALRNALQTASGSAFRTERISENSQKRVSGWMKERKENRFPSADGRRKRKQIKTGPNPMKKTVLETGPVPERRKTVLQGLEWAGTEVPAPERTGMEVPALE